MAKRLTSEKVIVEYKDALNYLRLTNMKTMVEYMDTLNYLRLSSIAVMVEYVQLSAPAQAPLLALLGVA